MEENQTPYVADNTVPPAQSSDSSKSSTTGPLWALAGMMSGEYLPLLVDEVFDVCVNLAFLMDSIIMQQVCRVEQIPMRFPKMVGGVQAGFIHYNRG